MDVALREVHPENIYLWGVRVWTRDEVPVHRYLYKSQIFSPPLGTHEKVTLRDSIPLQPGKYYVRLSLYRYTDPAKLQLIEDVDQAERYEALGGRREVEVF